jgi:hypothetical protein
MSAAIMGCDEAEKEGQEDKNNYSFLFRSKNQSILDCFPPGNWTQFQFREFSFMCERTRTERNFFLMLAW